MDNKVAGRATCANHRMVWMSRAKGHHKHNCEQPDWGGCEACGYKELWRCNSSRVEKCRPCGERYRRRVGRVALSGRLAGGQVHMLTLTAPGTKVHRLPNGQECPCTPAGGEMVGQNLEEWNAELGKRWNRFCQDLRRHLGRNVQYFKATEVQARGALHSHIPFRVDAGCRWNLAEIRALAIKHGFGHEVDIRTGIDEKGMWYVAKYVSKAAGLRQTVPWRKVDTTTGEILDSATYRGWTASRSWGSTMKAVKAEQARWVACGGGGGAASGASPGPLDPNASRYTTAAIPDGASESWPM